MFDWRLHTRIVCGAGALAQLGELTRGLGTRALLVTDPGIVQVGHAARAEAFLSAAGVATAVFAAVHENPTTDDVEACLELARQFRPEVLIALGGGSAMDTAKGTNFILTRSEEHTSELQSPC